MASIAGLGCRLDSLGTHKGGEKCLADPLSEHARLNPNLDFFGDYFWQ